MKAKKKFRKNSHFVKDLNVLCAKMTRNGRKMAKIILSQFFLRIRLYINKISIIDPTPTLPRRHR